MKLGDRVKILAPVNGDSHAFQHCKGTLVDRRSWTEDHPWTLDVKIDGSGFEFVSFYASEVEVINEAA